MSTRKHLAILAVALFALAVTTSGAGAAKGGGKPGGGDKPGGGGGPTGTIYFHYQDAIYSMDADGGNKTLLEDAAPGGCYGGTRPECTASYDLHGGMRWFLAVEYIPGELNHYGLPMQQLFAIAEDGTSVQLTNDPELFLWDPHWAVEPGVGADARISAVGLDSSSESVEGGVYLADVAFDGGSYEGSITGLASPPALHAAFDLVPDGESGDLWPDLISHSFAPDGQRFVYRQRSSSKLRVWDAGTSSLLVDAGSYPAWSPDGGKIAYAWRGIYTVSPDGSDDRRLVGDRVSTTLGVASWSPTGSHLIYHEWDNLDWGVLIYRISARGTGKTNLTADIGSALALGWR